MQIKVLKWSVLVWIFFLPWQELLYFPVLQHRLQLPEMFFVISVLLFGVNQYKVEQLKKHLLKFILFLILPLFVWIQAAILPNTGIWLEGIALLYVIVSSLFIYMILKENLLSLRQIMLAFIASTLFIAFSGILIFLFPSLTNLLGDWWTYRDAYPYIGRVLLFSGPTPHPVMMAHLAGIGFVYMLLHKQDWKPVYKSGILLVCFTVLLFTFSKAAILCLGTCGLFIRLAHKPLHFLTRTVSSIIIIIALLSSHILFIKGNHDYVENPPRHLYKQLGEWSDYEVWLTSYSIIKIKSMEAFISHPILGVGYGRFTDYVAFLKENNRYPQHLTSFDTHSSFISILSETGIVGAILFSLIILYFIRHLNSLYRDHYLFLYAYFLFIFFEGLVTDWWHFRHVWILIGIVMFLTSENRKPPIAVPDSKRITED